MPAFSRMPPTEFGAVVDHMVGTGFLFNEAGVMWFGRAGKRSYGFRHFMEVLSVFTGDVEAPKAATNLVTRDYVIREGAPLAFLCSVVRGKRIIAAAEPGGNKRTHVFPSLDQRLRAAEILSRKVLPDLKATELTGKDGGPIGLTLLDFLKGLPG